MLNKNVILNLILGKTDENKKCEEEFTKEIQDTINEMKIAQSIFNSVSDEKLIEAAIFQEEAAKKKFEYLLSLAKKKSDG